MSWWSPSWGTNPWGTGAWAQARAGRSCRSAGGPACILEGGRGSVEAVPGQQAERCAFEMPADAG
eukprot:9478491-Lingulodinium_polyedra.AAC.1